MTDPVERPNPNPMNHPEEPETGVEGSPKFGRLLIVLVLVVIFMGVLTYVMETIYS